MHFLRSSRDGPDGISRRLRLALWPAGIMLGVGAEWIAGSGQSLAAAGADLVVGWAFISCGLIGWSRRPQSRVGLFVYPAARSANAAGVFTTVATMNATTTTRRPPRFVSGSPG